MFFKYNTDVQCICDYLIQNFISIGDLSQKKVCTIRLLKIQYSLKSGIASSYVTGSGQASLDKLLIAAKRTLNMHQNFLIMLQFDI